MDRKDGESFLVQVTSGKKGKPADLQINHLSGRCYLIDIERNVTKPEGWPRPLEQDRAAERVEIKR
jgi:hypothetical protein